MRYLTCLLALTLFAGPAAADPISLKRGVNTVLWRDWYTIASLIEDPTYLEVFPDTRRDVTPRMYASLLAQGFDFVRLPIDPGLLVEFGPGEQRERLIGDIRLAAEIALDSGLKVIVDLHTIPRGTDLGGVEPLLEDQWPDYVALVGEIAARLDGLPPDRTVIELINEPSIDCDAVYGDAPPRWPAMQAEAHAAARAGAPDLGIVLTGACWAQANALATLDPTLIADDNVIWTFHSYEPYLFTHQGAGWVPSIVRHFWNVPYPPSLVTDEIAAELEAAAIAHMTAETGTADREEIARAIAEYRALDAGAPTVEIDRAVAWADAHGVPRDRLLLGEFGALHSRGDDQMPREWYHAFLADKRIAAEAAGMGWAVLGYVGDMGVARDDGLDRKLEPATCRALGLPCGN